MISNRVEENVKAFIKHFYTARMLYDCLLHMEKLYQCILKFYKYFPDRCDKMRLQIKLKIVPISSELGWIAPY